MNEQEVLFYGEISNFSVSSFINRMAEAKRLRKDVNILANSSGGDPDSGYGMIKTIREFPFRKKLSIHGAAYSMMAFAALYVNEVQAIEQSLFLFHRAAAFFLEDEQIPALRELIISRNEDLRKAMEEKLNVAVFERISGVTLDELFSMDSRVDVILNAEQALEIGAISEIIPLSAVEAENINSQMMAASAGKGIQPLNISNDMKTLDELKEKHPELYAQAIEAGKKEAAPPPAPPANTDDLSDNEKLMAAGIEKERQRVAAWQVYAEVDPKKVTEGINSGKVISAADTQEFLLAAAKKNFAGALKKGTDTSGGTADGDAGKDTGLPEELNALATNVTASLTKKYKKAS